MFVIELRNEFHFGAYCRLAMIPLAFVTFTSNICASHSSNLFVSVMGSQRTLFQSDSHDFKNLIDQFRFENRKSLTEEKIADIQNQLVEIGEPAIKPLVRSLRTEANTYLVDVLTRIGAPAIPALVEELRRDNPRSFIPVVRTLAGIKSPHSTDALIHSLYSHLEKTREDKVKNEVGRINSKEVHLIEALGNIDDPRVIDVLEKAKTDSRKIVRIFAAKNLFQFRGKEEDKNIIVKSLMDLNSEVRVIAITFSAKRKDLGTIEQLRYTAANDVDYRVRKKAVSALQERKDLESAELIKEIAFKDPSSDVQQIAASAYATMKGEAAIPILLDLLKEQELKEKTSEKFKSAIKGIFFDRVLQNRYKIFTLKLSIVRTLGSIDGEVAGQALSEIQRDNRDTDVRDFARIELLRRRSGLEAIRSLIQLIENQDEKAMLGGSTNYFVSPKSRLVSIRAREILNELQNKHNLN